MSAEQLEKLCEAARQRLKNFVHRMAAQQQRRMRETWIKQP